MQTSGFLTRSVASFAISRNFARALVAVEALGFASLETEELLPVAALLVHLAQVVDGAAVLGIDGDDRFVGLHGLGLVRELAGVELGGLRVERDLLVRVWDHARELEQRLDVLVVTLVRFLLVGERAELGDLAALRVASRLPARRGRPLRERRGWRRGLRAGATGAGIGGRLTAGSRGGDGVSTRAREASDLAAAAAATGAAETAGRVGRSAPAGRGGTGPRRAGLAGAFESCSPICASKARSIGCCGSMWLRRSKTVRARIRVPELAPRDGAGLREEERRVAVLAGVRDRLFGEREHAIPVAALAAVGVAQVVERAFVLGIELDRLLEELRACVDVLMTRHPARAEDVRQLRAHLLVGLVLEELRLQRLELLELAALAHHSFVERGGLLSRRDRRRRRARACRGRRPARSDA